MCHVKRWPRLLPCLLWDHAQGTDKRVIIPVSLHTGSSCISNSTSWVLSSTVTLHLHLVINNQMHLWCRFTEQVLMIGSNRHSACVARLFEMIGSKTKENPNGYSRTKAVWGLWILAENVEIQHPLVLFVSLIFSCMDAVWRKTQWHGLLAIHASKNNTWVPT